MKLHPLRLCALAAVATLITVTAFAHPEGHETRRPPAESSVALPASMGETLAAIQRQYDLLKTVLEENRLTAVQANALTLDRLVQHIVSQVPADHQADLKEIAARHAKQTGDLVKASAAGAQKQAADLVSKLGSNIRALQLLAH